MIKQKSVIISFSCLVLIVLGGALFSHAQSENYLVNKIKLGEFKRKNGLTASGTYSIPWLELQTSHITLDDNRRIYVLDKNSKKVFIFSPDGILIKSVLLKDVYFSDNSEEQGDDGYIVYQIQVSSDGSYLYITEGGKENNWSVFDSNGTPLKKNISLKWITRKCTNIFKADNGLVELDSSLKIIKKHKSILSKTEIIGNDIIYKLVANSSSDTFILSSKLIDGKEVWKKKLSGKSIRLLGTDGENNVYILMDSPLEICKINRHGEISTTISLPNNSFIRNWRYVSFNVLCDGTIYCVPTYLSLWIGKEKKDSSEYYLYRFDKVTVD